MSVEVLPVGVTCNLGCTYCYENDLRDATRGKERYQREAVLASIEKLNSHWSLFGGEALILHKRELEELLKLAFDKWGQSGIQTNGTLITEDHIELFRKYKTYVGISVDGPVDLNDSRWAGNQDATRKLSERSHWAIKRLAEEAKTHPHMRPSLIVTLHAGNCAKDKWPRFVEWLHELDAMGITYINPHVMELDSQAHTLFLPVAELADRMVDLWNMEFTNLKFSKFDEVLDLLQGKDEKVTCHWHACDPLNTAAVQSIDYDGAPSVCKRTFKGGQRWLPAEGTGYHAPLVGHNGSRHHTRQLGLHVTPQELGGCQGCEFWLMCMGQCPGEGEGQDWRKRSSYCHVWKRLFTEGERRLKLMGIKPLSQWKDRQHIEQLMYDAWVRSENPSVASLVKQHVDCTSKGMTPVKNGYHGDSGPEERAGS